MNIYVGNLSWTMTDDDLNNLFSQYGAVTSAKVLKDKVSGRSKGFGFVEMSNDAEAKAATEALNGMQYNGRELVANEARPREERPRREFSPRGGGYGQRERF